MQGTVALLTAASIILAWLQRRSRSIHRPTVNIGETADLLAVAASRRYETAATERQLLSPTAVPVHWRQSSRALAGSVRDAVSSRRFSALPGLDYIATSDLQQGDLDSLFSIYGGLGSGRLLIVGGPGAGKSSAAITLARDTLLHREGLQGSERQIVPVPVLVSLSSWNSLREEFHVWLERQVQGQYPFLASLEYGRQVVEELLNQGRLTLLLDGFDELPSVTRPLALSKLALQAATRIVLFSRIEEVVAAASEDGSFLAGAVALELEEIQPQDAAAYLQRCQVHPLTPKWGRLIHTLRYGSRQPIQAALNSPLSLTLVRDTYRRADDVDELLDASRFPNGAAIRAHLLERIIPAAYRQAISGPSDKWTETDARNALSSLAFKMNSNNTRELAWWALAKWYPAWSRTVISIAVVALPVGLVDWWVVSWAISSSAGVVFGLVFGLAAGLAFGVAGGRGGRPPHQLGRISWRSITSPRDFLRGALAGTVVGLAASPVVGIGDGAIAGLTAGVTFWIEFSLKDALGHSAVSPYIVVDPLSSWRRDRAYSAAFGLLTGLGAGAAAATTIGIITHDLHLGLVGGLLVGATAGISTGIVSGSTWAAWLTFWHMRSANETPRKLLKFLEDARARHVLRAVGPYYQFRHAELQDLLAARYPQ